MSADGPDQARLEKQYEDRFKTTLQEIATQNNVIISPVKIASNDFYYALLVHDPANRVNDAMLKMVVMRLQQEGLQEIDPRL